MTGTVAVLLVVLVIALWIARQATTRPDRKSERGAEAPGGTKAQATRRGATLAGRGKTGMPTLDSLLDLLPDLKEPGGRPATEMQRNAIERLALGRPPNDMSFEQASAILSARSYAEGVLNSMGLRHSFRVLQSNLIAYVVADRPLLERAIAWSDRSYARQSSSPPAPRRDEHWKKLIAEAQRLQSALD